MTELSDAERAFAEWVAGAGDRIREMERIIPAAMDALEMLLAELNVGGELGGARKIHASLMQFSAAARDAIHAVDSVVRRLP